MAIKVSKNCMNKESSYGEICVRCGRCGRKFTENGVDDSEVREPAKIDLENIKCTVCPHTAGYNTAIDDCVRTMYSYFCKLVDNGTDTDVMFKYNADLARLFEGLKNDGT